MSNQLTEYKPLTTLELFEGSDSLSEAFANDSLNAILSSQPKAEWVKEHPFIKNHKYLPIDKVEYLLRRIFKAYKIEITGQGTAFNGVWVTVRVHYLNPATGDWSFHDGIGASQLQTAKGTSAADLANINNGAIIFHTLAFVYILVSIFLTPFVFNLTVYCVQIVKCCFA